MPLESTMICLDNSDWMRNGDYAPTRIDSQQDAAGLICNDRTQSNPENTVGVLSMAGQGVDLLVSPTEDIGKILASFSRVSLGGSNDFASAVQVAQLALKHRKNKNGGVRIIAFVGSPLSESVAQLKKIGTLLKKNNIAVDVISFGETDQNNEKLLEFIQAVNSSDNSHLISVPPGVLPVDALSTSPVLHRSTQFGGGVLDGGVGGGANNFEDYGGFDPSVDPEMAMAIRVSIEEARAQAESRATATEGAAEPRSVTIDDLYGRAATSEEDEEALMQQALEMSMRDMATVSGPSDGTSASAASGGAADDAAVPAGASSEPSEGHVDEDDEEEALRLALQMSMEESAAGSTASNSSSGAEVGGAGALAAALEGVDPSFMSQLLGSVDVDPNDPLIQAALAQLQQGGAQPPPGGDAKDKESKKRKGDDA